MTEKESTHASQNLGTEDETSFGRFARLLLTGAFPVAAIIVIAAFGLILQLRAGQIMASPSSTAGELVGIVVVSGISSMAIVQVVKSLLGLRGLYQRRQVIRWFTQQQGGYQGYLEFLSALAAANVSNRDPRYLFDLPIEQLCAQVSGAADMALASPSQFDAFLKCLVGYLRTDSASDDADRQIRVSHYVRSSIDELQVSVGHRWRRYVRSTAVWLSGLIGIAIVEASQTSTRARGLDVLAALLVGGFVAWFARDVAALVERLRG
jgi:hypothetical protein